MPAYFFSPYAIAPAVTAGALVVCAVVVLRRGLTRLPLALAAVGVAGAAWQVNFVLGLLPRLWMPFTAAAVYLFVTCLLPPSRHRLWICAAAWLAASLHAWAVWRSASTAVTAVVFTAIAGAALVELLRAREMTAGADADRLRLFAIALGAFALAVVELASPYGARFPVAWLALLTSAAVAAVAVVRHGVTPVIPSLPPADIIGTMRDLLLVTDRDGTIRFANNAASTFLGYAREEIVGRNLADVLAPTSSAELTTVQGWIRDREYVFRTRLGQPIELTLSHSPILRDGEIAGTVIVGRDLRDRKRYEWEARRAVTLLQSTLDSTADGILVIGEDGRVLTWNQRFLDIWGIPPELMSQDEDQELIGQIVDRLVDPAGFLDSLAALHEHPEAESVQVLELKDGRRLEQYSIGRYLDEVALRVWSFRDITARLAAEQGLRDSEARYRLLFEQNAAGVCLITVGGTIVDCNATFAAMVDHSAHDLHGRELAAILSDSTALEAMHAQLEESPTVRGVELEMRRPDGEKVSVLANVSLVGAGDDSLVHMTAVDISDRKRAEKQVKFQAYHDPLTQLPNRRLFVERLELSILAAKRARGNVAVLFIDLDRFKTINDTLGHSVADVLLIEIANRLRACVRQTDTVARHGGDEFTVILPDLHQPEDAAQVAEKILERVVEPVLAGNTSIEISVSIGIAVYPYDGADVDTLLRNADDAMYRAKQAGRNTYQLCTEQMKTRAAERLSMQGRLRKAMAADELALVYQPRMSLVSGRVVAGEVLVRWNDPEQGTLEADAFIPVAEETPLIVPLGEWMLFTACGELRRWQDAGLQNVRMAVGISARQFQQRDLSALVRRAVDECGVDPSRLELEIRETTAMRDVGLTIELLKLLRETGARISVGDFGSAHSSLGSLRVLPVDAVKLDRSLLAHVPTGIADAAIVDAVVAVSSTLGLRVVANGIETWEQLDFCKVRGCHEGQGSYFGVAAEAGKFRVLAAEAFPVRASEG
jgi:diguanylate cyclase (GGDEF)-like protein/PAS domain S-box-containing protein